MSIKTPKLWLIVTLSIIGVIILSAFGVVAWYSHQLRPIDSTDTDTIRIDVKDGATARQIADQLEEKKAIRSALVMTIYLRLHETNGEFRTGVYSVSPAQSLEEIVAHMTSGKADEISVMFYPGATLRDPTDTSESAKTDVATSLKRAGFSETEITQALNATYTGDVFNGRPDGQGIEGYVYGETYFLAADATAEQVVQRAIDEMANVVRVNDLEAKFAKQGLTLYQGITMASIVQRESIGCGAGAKTCEDQRQIASVFYNRLKADISLGSDVTYHYAADMMGVARNANLDSPYNTRIHKGLPPGPIATPGLSALNAVADPAVTDYLFFISGDDDVTYFAKTNEEHEQNVHLHCQEKCLLP